MSPRSNSVLNLLIALAIIALALLVVDLVYGQNIFDAKGKPFAKRAQQTREPKIIVDTVSIVAGHGALPLNDKFSSGSHSVSATDSMNIWATATKILADTTDTPYAYGCYPVANGTSIKIVSSGGAADTGRVVIVAFIK